MLCENNFNVINVYKTKPSKNRKYYLLKKIGIGAGAVASGRIIGMLATFLFNAILARMISQDEMGYYFLILSLVTFFAIFARSGCENLVLKLVADALSSRSANEIRQLIKKFSILFGFSSFVTVIVCWFLLQWLFNSVFSAPQLAELVPLMCIWLVMIAAQLVLGQTLRAFKHFLACSFLSGPLSSVMNLVGMLLINGLGQESSFFDVLILIVCNLTVVIALAIYYVFKSLEDCSYETEVSSNEKVSNLLLLSVPLFITQLAMFSSSQSDIWLMSAFLPPDQIGLYGASAKLVFLLSLSLAIANGVLPPYIADFRNKGDIVGLQKILRFVATLASMPALIGIFVLFFFSESIMGFVYGESYSIASDVVKILCLGQLVNVMVGSCGYVLIMFGFNQLLMKLTIFFGLLAFVGGYILLINGFGLIEMAILNVFVLSCQQLCLLYFAKQKCGVFTATKIFLTRSDL